MPKKSCDIGQMVLEFIIASGLVRADGKEPVVFIWSANAAEQIGEFIKRNGGGSK